VQADALAVLEQCGGHPQARGVHPEHARTPGQGRGIVGFGQEVGRVLDAGQRGPGGAPRRVAEDAAQRLLHGLALHRDQRRVVQVLPDVDVGVARQDLTAQRIGRGIVPPGVVSHGAQRRRTGRHRVGDGHGLLACSACWRGKNALI
jgi:hypothetical protein